MDEELRRKSALPHHVTRVNPDHVPPWGFRTFFDLDYDPQLEIYFTTMTHS